MKNDADRILGNLGNQQIPKNKGKRDKKTELQQIHSGANTEIAYKPELELLFCNFSD